MNRPSALAGVAAVVVLTSCSPSTGDLERAARDLPGVTSVKAVENDGDDAFPLQDIPKTVTVTMKQRASVNQVRAVIDEYRDEIDDGDVQGLDLVLKGKHTSATLSLGEGIEPDEAVVKQLVAAAREPDVESYYREDYPVGGSSSIALGTVGFARVAEVLGKFAPGSAPDGLSVTSDGFAIASSSRAAQPRLTRRLRMAQAVDKHFTLQGCRIGGSGTPELVVAPGTDLRAVRRFVATVAGYQGKVLITDEIKVDLGRATGAARANARYVVNQIRFDPTLNYARYRDGELRIGVDNLDELSFVESSFLDGTDPHFRATKVHYLFSNGNDVLKLPGATVRQYLPFTLSKQQQWRSFSLTVTPTTSHLVVHARAATTARAAAKALGAVGQNGTATIIWPRSTGLPTVTLTVRIHNDEESVVVTGTRNQRLRTALIEGWKAGVAR